MTFADLIHQLIADTVHGSLAAFSPELAVCGTIVALLVGRMLVPAWKTIAWYIMMAGLAVAIRLLIPDLWAVLQDASPRTTAFTGLLAVDSFSIFLRGLLLVFGLLFTTFVQISGVPDDDDAAEFGVLVLGALLGMCLMVSANHMLIVFLGIEMASVPCYVLAGLLRGKRKSTEAALKYAVFGAGAAGIMLYGISLMCGMLGSASLPAMAIRLAELNVAGLSGDQSMVLVLGALMLTVGLAFKLSLFPFHFWAPDVFEGAPAEVGAFLSIASKAAALGLLVRLALGFTTVGPLPVDAMPVPGGLVHISANQPSPQGETLAENMDLTPSRDQTLANALFLADDPTFRREQLTVALEPARKFAAGMLAILAAVTCTFGNLAAYGQTNIKRLLAYSTIAHAGYLLMPIAAAVAVAGRDPLLARYAVATMVFYVAIYLFMNFGAFAIVAFLRNALGSEEIDDYAGLMRRSPGVTVCMALILFSLVGLPPLAGFAAKFAIFGALVKANMLVLLVIGGLNTVLSLFYYLRVVKVMILAPETAQTPRAGVSILSIPGLYAAVMTLPIVVLFVWWNTLFTWAKAAAASLLL